MRKLLSGILLLILLLSFCSCTLGNNYKNVTYQLEIQDIYRAYLKVEGEEDKSVFVAHCKRGFSTFNYYILLPDEAPVNTTYLIAEKTDDKADYYVDKGNELVKVTDHGYKFKDWGD